MTVAILDRKGRRYGRLVVERFVVRAKGRTLWMCVCDCGNSIVCGGSDLTSGRTTSCGCYHRERVRESHFKHGDTPKVAEYRCWRNMLARCSNPRSTDYKHYGGRGIKVCSQWAQYKDFLTDMGRKPGPSYSIDRIDVNGNYEPGNCHWATQHEQNSNKRRA